MKTCNREDSGRFLTRRMSADEESAFEEHLETCADCREQLERSAGPENAWQAARELLVHDFAHNHALRSTWGVSADHSPNDSEPLPSCTSSVVLSILAPTDDPAMLGRIGPYEISGIVGRGSAGIVLKGFDRSLNRNVAIKVLDPAMADVGAARVRFSREARAMAAIAHEHLVPVYEVNEHAGIPYFVMEYVPGGSLERRLRDAGPLDCLSVARIGLQVAQALAAAHAQGLVHRDIKPGNILLDRGTDRVRVVDFGLVRVANDVSCTRSGIIAGTPQYMAPEQVRAEVCDAQSDLFSLGAVLYALCTGHPAFRADTVYGVMQRIVHDAPRSIREQNPSIPEWLEQFIERLMAKERTLRFATASEVAEILQHQLAHLLSPDAVPAPPRGWIRRNTDSPSHKPQRRVFAGGAMLCALALIVGTSFWLGKMFPTESDNTTNDLADGNGRSAGTDELNQPKLRPTVPLWNADGANELLASTSSLERQWQPTSPRSTPDLWLMQLADFQRSIGQLSSDVEASQKVESSSTRP
jgi:serine/threonine-protein kinase